MKEGIILYLVWITAVVCHGTRVSCPSECQCSENGQQFYVSCASQSLTSLPKNIPNLVTHLDLHGNALSSLTDVFHTFNQLQILDLSFNNLTTFDFEDLRFGENIVNLNLSHNNISDLKFGNASYVNLTTLILANNSIKSLNDTALMAFPNLERLELQENQISVLNKNSFNFIKKLTYLDISGNELLELPGEAFLELDSMKVLNLSHNQLNIFDGNIFSVNSTLDSLDLSYNIISAVSNLMLPNLRIFDLSGNNITNISLVDFQRLTNLSFLQLDDNPMGSIKSPAFEHLNNLRKLSMSYMPNLSYLSKSTFTGLENLRHLILSHNPNLSFIHKDLFKPLASVSIIDLSYNSVETLHNETLSENSQLSTLVIRGNNLVCDCELEWMIQSIQGNESIISDRNQLQCAMRYSGNQTSILDIDTQSLHCTDVIILNYTKESAFKIGKPAILQCIAESVPSPEIVWITPRKRVFKYHNFHEYSLDDYQHFKDEALHNVPSAEDKSYYDESETRPDRIRILKDGSLFIEFVMRSDGGPYKCIARNPHNSTEVVINFKLDYTVINEVKIWSLVVGFGCAGGFFLLNLTYSLIHAAVRRCISQSRRERIKEVLENMDQYKKANLARIKENYNTQVGRIRDQYHYRLGRLREHHQNQSDRMGRMREGASQRVEKMRENYNHQLGKLKDYSSSQLEQLRDKYNNQVDKIKDYGNDKYDKLHEKYKIKQQHFLKLLEMMNLDNCRTVFDSECVRTESMILNSEVFTTDDRPLDSPIPIDSSSASDSEYVTATSSEVSKYSSKENVNTQTTDIPTNEANSDTDIPIPINPYIPDTDDNETDNNDSNLMELMNADNSGSVNHGEGDTTAASTSAKKSRKHEHKHSKRNRKKKKETYPNINQEELEKLYKDFCDKKIDIDELAKIVSDKQQQGIWFTRVNPGAEPSAEQSEEHIQPDSADVSESNEAVGHKTFAAQYDGAPAAVDQISEGSTHRSGRKHNRNSSSNPISDSTTYGTSQDDVGINIPDDEYYDSWTIKESVV